MIAGIAPIKSARSGNSPNGNPFSGNGTNDAVPNARPSRTGHNAGNGVGNASEGGDDFLDGTTETGGTVRHGENSTAIGDDTATTNNFNNATDTGRGHNVIVHGTLDYDELGGIPTVNGQPTNPAQVAEAVRNNPDYIEGSQVCFASCWSGSSGTAQDLANELGAPVMAPTRPVRFNTQTGDFEVQTNLPDRMNDFNPQASEIEPDWVTVYPED